MLTLGALGGASKCLEDTIQYATERKMFGQTLSKFGNTREVLSMLTAKLEAGKAIAHQALGKLIAGERCRREVSLAKYLVCEFAIELADKCLQLHGGYGYMQEYPISRMFVDARIQKIYGGTNEIMKVLIARSL